MRIGNRENQEILVITYIIHIFVSTQKKYYMATITISRKENTNIIPDFNEYECDTVKRNFFREGLIYGGPKDIAGGTWHARKIEVVFKNECNEEVKRNVWAVAYVITDSPRGLLFKSFLLSNGRFDASNNLLKAKGDVRCWADRHIINGILEKEWCVELANELNSRGLIYEVEIYQQPTADGKSYAANFYHPYFADTYQAE